MPKSAQKPIITYGYSGPNVLGNDVRIEGLPLLLLLLMMLTLPSSPGVKMEVIPHRPPIRDDLVRPRIRDLDLTRVPLVLERGSQEHEDGFVAGAVVEAVEAEVIDPPGVLGPRVVLGLVVPEGDDEGGVDLVLLLA